MLRSSLLAGLVLAAGVITSNGAVAGVASEAIRAGAATYRTDSNIVLAGRRHRHWGHHRHRRWGHRHHRRYRYYNYGYAPRLFVPLFGFGFGHHHHHHHH